MTTEHKQPQDRRKKGANVLEETAARFEDIEGHELLKPFTQVKGSDQLRLMSQLQKLGIPDAESTEVDVNSLDLDKVADLVDWVAERFAVDVAAFEDFTTGKGGFERALTLATSYAGALGESEA